MKISKFSFYLGNLHFLSNLRKSPTVAKRSEMLCLETRSPNRTQEFKSIKPRPKHRCKTCSKSQREVPEGAQRCLTHYNSTSQSALWPCPFCGSEGNSKALTTTSQHKSLLEPWFLGHLKVSHLSPCFRLLFRKPKSQEQTKYPKTVRSHNLGNHKAPSSQVVINEDNTSPVTAGTQADSKGTDRTPVTWRLGGRTYPVAANLDLNTE